MDPSSRKSNKIRDIVRLQQILKKWKKVANSNRSNSINGSNSTSPPPPPSSSSGSTAANKSIKFLKKTLSFSEREMSSSSTAAIPKGYVAVCVGKELKRFVIPTEYLSHQVFGILLREAEEEFGFQQEGVLKFPCEVDIFHKVLKMMEDKRSFSSPSLTMLLQDQDKDQDQDQQQQGDYTTDHNNNIDHHVIINCTSNNYSPDTTQHRPQMCR